MRIPRIKEIKSYIESQFRKIALSRFGDLLLKTSPYLYTKLYPEHYLEQVYLRAYLSKNCMYNGTCLACGCCQKEKIFSNVACERLYLGEKEVCYGELVNKQEWEDMKIYVTDEILNTGRKLILDSKNCEPFLKSLWKWMFGK